MGTQKTKTKTNETATTTPNLPTAAQPAVNNYFTGVGALTPEQMSTPANSLQTGVFNRATGLLGQSGTDIFGPAIGMLGGVQQAPVTTAQAPGAYSPVQATAQTAALPGAYTPGQATTAAYGPVAQATAGNLGGPAQVDVAGLLDGISAGSAGGGRALTYMGDYMNPYQQQVIDTSLADLSNSQAADRAAYARQGALNGAFGGSRYGLGETNLLDAQNRTRNTMGANLRSEGWKTALGAGQADASNATSASVANANNATQIAAAKLNAKLQAAQGNQSASNDFLKTGYTTNADLSKANAGFLNTALGNIFDQTSETNRFNTSQGNDAAKTMYQAAVDNGQFNVDQGNQMATNNARFQNDALNTAYTTQADMNRFNADAANQGAQFNTNLSLDKANALGGFLGDAANFDTNLLGTLGGIGNDQYNIDAANSPYAQYSNLANLINGGGLLGTATGQTINSNGTSTAKQSGGLGSALMGGLFSLGSAYLGR